MGQWFIVGGGAIGSGFVLVNGLYALVSPRSFLRAWWTAKRMLNETALESRQGRWTLRVIGVSGTLFGGAGFALFGSSVVTMLIHAARS